MYTNIFAEKKWVAFQKLLTFFQQKYLWIRKLYLLEQWTFWPLTSSLS